MADHPVKLHYTKNPDPSKKPLFRPEPRTIFVQTGQTIAFQKTDESLPGTIHITFHNPEIFSVPHTDGSSEVHVTGTPKPTTYHCQLLDDHGNSLADSDEDPNGGGEIQPGPPPE
jgi:hypothetical protein